MILGHIPGNKHSENRRWHMTIVFLTDPEGYMAAMDAQTASPTRRKEGFWLQAKRAAVVRVWARLCARSRGEGANSR